MRSTRAQHEARAIQEQGTVHLWLTLGEDASEWAILGNYQDCREGLARCHDEIGLTP